MLLRHRSIEAIEEYSHAGLMGLNALLGRPVTMLDMRGLLIGDVHRGTIAGESLLFGGRGGVRMSRRAATEGKLVSD